MSIQYSTTVRNARADAVETAIGTSPILKIRTGAQPATCATADSGTVLASITCPSDWQNAASSGSKTLNGTWQDAAADASGTPGHYRIYDSGGTTCHEQGTCGQSFALATNGSTAANGNVLNFASTTGVAVGQTVSGTGIPTGATVVALTSTTVTISHTSTAGVSNGASITFGYDLNLDAATINANQVVNITTFTRTEPNA